ncbi:putative secreted protein [Wickerhamomyces ciferrii]|uniref:Secreted protein n=1 Tax=Wickerhamomyces ciferrii (strain ATCC 14091 / BCRC 22168 / CBS 111 / JCM 3599 / NBRC 0793 / NRRL Y-1031 F-60-10) TaxID=1206466 RepID=K0KPU4_WICCF|nr:uncharacterized protein BN7_2740 [Wickerhamomyces ciferrii]CCH43193.1 putative secreted protein [Wickerhamomyces ciferrii]
MNFKYSAWLFVSIWFTNSVEALVIPKDIALNSLSNDSTTSTNATTSINALTSLAANADAAANERFLQEFIYNGDISANGWIENWYNNNSGKIALYQSISAEIRTFFGVSGIYTCLPSLLDENRGQYSALCLYTFFTQESLVFVTLVGVWILDIPNDDATGREVLKHNLNRGVKKYRKFRAWTKTADGSDHKEVEAVSFRLNALCALGAASCTDDSTDADIVAIRDETGVHININTDPSVTAEEFEQIVLKTVPGVPVDYVNEDGSVSDPNDGATHDIKFISYNIENSVASRLSKVVDSIPSGVSPFDSLKQERSKDKKGLRERTANRVKAIFGSSESETRPFTSCFAGAGDAGNADHPVPYGVVGQIYYNSYGPADDSGCYDTNAIKKSLI